MLNLYLRPPSIPTPPLPTNRFLHPSPELHHPHLEEQMMLIFSQRTASNTRSQRALGCRRAAQLAREHGSPQAAEIWGVFADSSHSEHGNSKVSTEGKSREGGQKGTEEQQRQPRTDGLCDQHDDRTSASCSPAVSYSKVAHRKGSACSRLSGGRG